MLPEVFFPLQLWEPIQTGSFIHLVSNYSEISQHLCSFDAILHKQLLVHTVQGHSDIV